MKKKLFLVVCAFFSGIISNSGIYLGYRLHQAHRAVL